jgi:hypothetical protein
MIPLDRRNREESPKESLQKNMKNISKLFKINYEIINGRIETI